MKRLLTLTAATLFIMSCGEPTETPTDNTPTDTVAATPQPVDNWKYGTTVDEMTEDTTWFCSTYSTNTIDFDFPYDGGSRFRLTLRHSANGNDDVILDTDKGQFIHVNNEKVSVKFDDGDIMDMSFSEPDSYNPNIIFINDTKAFLNKVKTAKKLMIKAPFYQAGDKVIKFDVDGLKWEY